MIFDAASFSQFENCPRYPQLYRTFEPPLRPIRDVCKRFFESGIRGVMAGESPELTVQSFLAAAASPGFLYPEGEHYQMAQDYASWLDGALRIILEENPSLEQLPLVLVGDHHVHLEAWEGSDGIHIFRASTSLNDRTVRWPELVGLAAFGSELHIHVFHLPSVRDGRLISPLVTAYQHPSFTNIQYRIARLFDEDEFSKSWKKVSRWEIQPNPSWPEWKLGIDRDKAIDKIRQVYTVANEMDDSEKERLIFNIEALCVAMESPTIYPLLREKCQKCIFNGLCHGDADSRRDYKILGPEEIERIKKISIDTP